MTEQGALIPDRDNEPDYVMIKPSTWITVGGFALHIRHDEVGKWVSVDMTVLGDADGDVFDACGGRYE